MKRILLIFLLMTALAGSLIFSPMSKARAYEPCDTANPNYCTECRDESKRDFAKCGEIDYRNINLMKSDRLRSEPDIYNGKVVFTADISTVVNKEFLALEDLVGSEKCTMGDLSMYYRLRKENKGKIRYEIFLANVDGSNQERLTYSQGAILCGIPIFTRNGKGIVYKEVDLMADYAKRYPNDEQFKLLLKDGTRYANDYTLAIGCLPYTQNRIEFFAATPHYINLSNYSNKRLKIAEESKLCAEREKQKKRQR